MLNRVAWSLTAATLLLCAQSSLAAQAAVQTSMVDVGGHKLYVQLAGTARPGTATVVFVSGLGSPVEQWTRVQTAIAESTTTIAYDRSGINKSELAKEAPTIRTLSERCTLFWASSKRRHSTFWLDTRGAGRSSIGSRRRTLTRS